jgi:hypothetical protein
VGTLDETVPEGLTNLSLPRSSHSIGKRGQSPAIPEPKEVIVVRRVPSRDDETDLPTPDHDAGNGNYDPAYPGQWALQHHRGNLLEVPDRDRNPDSILGFMFYWLRSRLTVRLSPRVTESRSESIESYASYASEMGQTVESGSGHVRVSFAELQRMRLRKLQIKLVNHAAQMHSSGEESEGWEETLQQYSECHAIPKPTKLDLSSNYEYTVQALRDYDYIGTCVQRLKDPFIVTSERKIDAIVLENALRITPASMNFRFPQPDLPFPEPTEKYNEPIGGTRRASFEKARLKAFTVRLGMAIIGGGLLIGPMWLMVLHKTHYTALISTSVLVLIFGVIMAWVIEDLVSVVSATAAYAAVLVVFVGTNTG